MEFIFNSIQLSRTLFHGFCKNSFVFLFNITDHKVSFKQQKTNKNKNKIRPNRVISQWSESSCQNRSKQTTELVFNNIQLPGFITPLSFSLDKISDIKKKLDKQNKIFAKLNF